jgi:nucleoside-diphosphate-sugar epimerase
MRVLAIGATGFIGSPIVRRLIQDGHDVAVFHRGETPDTLPAAVRRIRGDRERLSDSRADFEGFAPDVVLDAILYTERQAHETTQALRGMVRRVVALGSADVYRNYDGLRGKSAAPPDPVPLTEEAPLRETRYPYRGAGLPLAFAEDYEKILVERTLQGDRELETTILRLPAVYGPGDRQHRLRPYVQRMVDGRPAILLQREQASWRWTRGFVENVAAAITRVVTDERAAGRVYNVGEETAWTEWEWVGKIGAALGWNGAVVALDADRLPDPLRQPFDWRYDLSTDTSRIRRELGYAEPVSIEDAVDRTARWERQELQGAERLDYEAEDAAIRSAANG